jgi:hypothetical protein
MTIEELRVQIDALDRRIVELISERVCACRVQRWPGERNSFLLLASSL